MSIELLQSLIIEQYPKLNRIPSPLFLRILDAQFTGALHQDHLDPKIIQTLNARTAEEITIILGALPKLALHLYDENALEANHYHNIILSTDIDIVDYYYESLAKIIGIDADVLLEYMKTTSDLLLEVIKKDFPIKKRQLHQFILANIPSIFSESPLSVLLALKYDTQATVQSIQRAKLNTKTTEQSQKELINIAKKVLPAEVKYSIESDLPDQLKQPNDILSIINDFVIASVLQKIVQQVVKDLNIIDHRFIIDQLTKSNDTSLMIKIFDAINNFLLPLVEKDESATFVAGEIRARAQVPAGVPMQIRFQKFLDVILNIVDKQELATLCLSIFDNENNPIVEAMARVLNGIYSNYSARDSYLALVEELLTIEQGVEMDSLDIIQNIDQQHLIAQLEADLASLPRTEKANALIMLRMHSPHLADYLQKKLNNGATDKNPNRQKSNAGSAISNKRKAKPSAAVGESAEPAFADLLAERIRERLARPLVVWDYETKSLMSFNQVQDYIYSSDCPQELHHYYLGQRYGQRKNIKINPLMDIEIRDGSERIYVYKLRKGNYANYNLVIINASSGHQAADNLWNLSQDQVEDKILKALNQE